MHIGLTFGEYAAISRIQGICLSSQRLIANAVLLRVGNSPTWALTGSKTDFIDLCSDLAIVAERVSRPRMGAALRLAKKRLEDCLEQTDRITRREGGNPIPPELT